MSKILIGIVTVTSGLALVISISANAASTQTPDVVEHKSQAVNKHLQLLNTNSEITESEMPSGNRFPLMLPQPTKLDKQHKYAIG